MKNKILSLLAVLVIAACANESAQMTTTQSSVGNVVIGPDLTLVLPRPTDLGRKVEATQLVTAHFAGQTLAFESHISATSDHFMLVCVDLMGRKAISIDWTQNGITYEAAPWVPSQLQPQNILADMVLLYWPEAVARKSLAASNGKLDVIGNRRIVLANDKEIMRAEYQPAKPDDLWSGRIHYSNDVWRYDLDIQSTEGQ